MLTPEQIASIKAQILALEKQLLILINSQPISMTGEKIYTAAAENLGKHLTLNDAIPAEIGCAEAVSKILFLAGIYTADKGIAGTATLDAWLASSPSFERIELPEEGAIIVSPTGQGNGTVVGHTGIVGRFGNMYPQDWGICSNDSATGLFLERWSFARWQAYYGITGGLPVHVYRAK